MTVPTYPSSVAHSLQTHRPYPRGRHSICRPRSTCLRQCTSPTTNTVLHPQLPIYVERLIRLNLHLPDSLTRCNTLINWRFELIAPRTPPAIPVTVVVAAQEITLRFGALLDAQRDID